MFYIQFLIDAKVTSDEGPPTVDDVTPLLSSGFDRYHSPKLFLKARMDPVPFVKVNDAFAITILKPGQEHMR